MIATLRFLFLFIPGTIFSGILVAQASLSGIYAGHITSSLLEKHLQVIAHDTMQGRETGTIGQRKTAAYIEARFSEIGLLTPKGLSGYQQYFSVIRKDTIKGSNVIGIIEGSDKKDEYVFITAHYDHLGEDAGEIYNGADDDGSGTSAVIAMAEAFSKAKAEGNGPRRTLVFMTVSGEEKGLLGSRYYSDNPIYPLNKTSIDLNIDMIGRVDTERALPDTLNYVYVVGHDKISSELAAVLERVNVQSANLTLDYKFDSPNDPQRIFYRSDHYNFAKNGVPVLFFYDGMLLGDYHQPTDDIEKINWPLFEKRTRLIFHTAWEMANRNDLLIRDLPLPALKR